MSSTGLGQCLCWDEPLRSSFPDSPSTHHLIFPPPHHFFTHSIIYVTIQPSRQLPAYSSRHSPSTVFIYPLIHPFFPPKYSSTHLSELHRTIRSSSTHVFNLLVQLCPQEAILPCIYSPICLSIQPAYCMQDLRPGSVATDTSMSYSPPIKISWSTGIQ